MHFKTDLLNKLAFIIINSYCKFKTCRDNEVLDLKDVLQLIDKNRIRTFTPSGVKTSLQVTIYRACTHIQVIRVKLINILLKTTHFNTKNKEVNTT